MGSMLFKELTQAEFGLLLFADIFRAIYVVEIYQCSLIFLLACELIILRYGDRFILVVVVVFLMFLLILFLGTHAVIWANILLLFDEGILMIWTFLMSQYVPESVSHRGASLISTCYVVWDHQVMLHDNSWSMEQARTVFFRLIKQIFSISTQERVCILTTFLAM